MESAGRAEPVGDDIIPPCRAHKICTRQVFWCLQKEVSNVKCRNDVAYGWCCAIFHWPGCKHSSTHKSNLFVSTNGQNFFKHKHISHILSYQICEVSSSKPGVLLLRKSSSSAIEEISILRNSANSIAIGQIPLSCSLSLSLMQQQQANASNCVRFLTVQVTSARVHRSKHFNCCVHFAHSIGLDCVHTV